MSRILIHLTMLAATPIVYFAAAGVFNSTTGAILLSAAWAGAVLRAAFFHAMLCTALRERDQRAVWMRVRATAPLELLYIALLVACLSWALHRDALWLAVAVAGWLTLVAAASLVKYFGAVKGSADARIVSRGPRVVLPRLVARQVAAVTGICGLASSCVVILCVAGDIRRLTAGVIVAGLMAAMAAGIVMSVVRYYRSGHGRLPPEK